MATNLGNNILGNNQYFNNSYRYIIALAILFVWCLLKFHWKIILLIQEFKKMTDELLQVMWKLNQKKNKVSSTSFNFSQSFELYGQMR